ncbi:MAG TPA: hypothetical protein VHL80_02225, partial [Polyangia bacterium]|nr:hypothetical protein [Polyangia bacterium]
PAIDAGTDATAAPDAASEPVVQIPRIACDVSCPGGPRAARAGAPIVIAAGPPQDRVNALAVGPDAVYYGTVAGNVQARGQLVRVPLAGGPATALKTDVEVERIRLDRDGTVYFVAGEVQAPATRLWSIAGAGPAVVSDVNDYGMDAVPTSGGLVWVEKATPPGGIIEHHGSTDAFSASPALVMGTPHGLALDDVDFYWADGDGPSRLSRHPQNENSGNDEYGTVMTTAADTLASPIAAGADLYFLHAHPPGDCQGSVMVIPTAGGTPSLVSLGHSGSDVSSLAVDDAFVYWTTPDAGGLVFRAARGGGAPEVVATEQAAARGVAVGAARVYWIATAAGGDEVRALDE